MKRFQECSYPIKIWRCRWYLLIPFKWIYYHIKSFKIYEHETNNYYVSRGKELWKILIGDAQIKMKWYYTSDEVFKRLKDE